MKKFLKTYTKATLWLGVFLFVEFLSLIGVIWFSIYHIPGFASYFLSVLEPIMDYANAGQYIDYASELGRGYMSMMSSLSQYALVVSLVPMLLILLCSAFIAKRKNGSEMPIQNTSYTLEIIAFGLFLNMTISFLMNILMPILPEAWVSSLSSSTGIATSGNLWFAVLSCGIAGPIIEEICFRYGLMRTFKTVYPRGAIYIQAILFGLAHGNIIQGVYTFILGMAFGYVYEKSNYNLMNSILLHCVINTSSVLIAGLGMSEYLVLCSLAFSFMAIHYVWLKRFPAYKKQCEIIIAEQ